MDAFGFFFEFQTPGSFGMRVKAKRKERDELEEGA
jgi:hypothetical protein